MATSITAPTVDGDRVLVNVLRAVADPTRLELVRLLSVGPRRAGELADETGVPAPSISKHLRVLLNAGVVTDERMPDDARARIFRMSVSSMAPVRAWLDQLQAHWDEQLGSFKRHIERKAMS